MEAALIVSIYKKFKIAFIDNNEAVCILIGVPDTSAFITHDHVFLYF